MDFTGFRLTSFFFPRSHTFLGTHTILSPYLVLGRLNSVPVPATELRVAITTGLRDSSRVITLLGIVTLRNFRSTGVTVAGTEVRVAIATGLRDSERVISLLGVVTLGNLLYGIAVPAPKLGIAVAAGLRDSERVIAFLSIVAFEELRDECDGGIAVSGIFRDAERVVSLKRLVGGSGKGEGGTGGEEEEGQVDELHICEYEVMDKE